MSEATEEGHILGQSAHVSLCVIDQESWSLDPGSDCQEMASQQSVLVICKGWTPVRSRVWILGRTAWF